MNILVTGFEPFDGETINPALEAARRLHGLRIGGYQVTAVELPCVFGASISTLERHMAALHPDIVLCVGQAGGRTGIDLERVALNIDDARIPDNAGRQPIDEPIVAGGPAAYFSGLPIKAIAAALAAAGIPAGVSQTAGTYVCNHVFYGMSHLIATRYPQVRGGFVHIPYLPEQAARHAGAASMALDTIVSGLKLALETAVAVTDDVKLQGGQTH
ncbi:pyroglutamyl-peptidase I [Undibacterium sp.]|uniref:pyroglutamyl-peptidase I n=1 Tax=Undibacterium sp. TaxID=1914977 RepID=UPI002C80C0FF|nr:pyroglutamyl-peptidase I [Undibacterium sp.]HTD04401.1 pyroglutamyl-peptidase I [Undibacterium sp.]